eukprot:CAMPEP_0174728578 /NCGR_PEP_ID=MMETSP1094-20130205/51969_1 /TAXON_ID=156173 /ORGANISM="Chrysochromulina brevifilum, Strain UTEX LB 985" /LENGTH=115 /DNA_ID=CAMNT_0015930529 /DNA_START=25 /DNA_END=372 /DNA_ORIENTATION=+
MVNDPWLSTRTFPDFKVTASTISTDAKIAAGMWLNHPAYTMTLSASRQAADTNQDGMIDRQEFRSLMQNSGYKGSSADVIFQSIDKDGDGKLTESEIRYLSQGQRMLAQGRRLGA